MADKKAQTARLSSSQAGENEVLNLLQGTFCTYVPPLPSKDIFHRSAIFSGI
jgi:hypothetical protein